ncbi:MAG: PEP-CTERM sorting domain-containing protein [Janthinobacterium lividum]
MPLSQAGDKDLSHTRCFITPYLSLYVDTDGPTTLSDQPGLGISYPHPPGDNAFAFEWERALSAGAAFSVSQVAVYGRAAVPEPATWTMILGGLAAVVAFSRGRTDSGVT